MSSLFEIIRNYNEIIKKTERKLRHNVKRYFFSKKLHAATPIFVFQMGKVASSSIFHSFRSSNYLGAVGHGHDVDPTNWKAKCLYDWNKNGGPLNIISTIREPIGRNVSHLFQHYESVTGVKYQKSNLTLEQTKDLFLKNMNHDEPLTWFDKNIKDIFGIDVYSTPFPPSGHIELSKGNINLLIMRFDLSDDIKQQLIQNFTHFSDYKIKNKNVSVNKIYYKTYKDFTSKVKLPKKYIEHMCTSKYFKHFFPENEINDIRAKWSEQ